jgi:dihydroorotate dehydrogenase electron transfer subunit
VIRCDPVAPEHFVLRLDAPPIARDFRPGQFVMLRPTAGRDPLLPRAFSIYAAHPTEGWIEVLFRVVGTGTRELADCRPGDTRLLWGPLGTSFAPHVDGPAVLVGGGVGVPPLVALAEWMARVMPSLPRHALIGAATASYLVGADRFAAAGTAVQVATDDGSAGHRGLVTDLLPGALEAGTTVYTCGPTPMLAAVARISAEAGVECQAALEAPMACGVGACVGCVTPLNEGRYARVCVEGPVLDASRVNWSAFAGQHL